MNIYYVYIHETADGTPFYVGKGKGNRAYKNDQRSESWKQLAKNGYNVHIVKDCMEEQAALDLEYFIINDFRKQFTLANKMARGWKTVKSSKPSPLIGKKKSPEHKAALSAARKGVPNPKLSAAKKGKSIPHLHNEPKTEEHRRNISKAKTGVPNPKMLGDLNPTKRPEVRAKMSASQIGKNVGENNPMFGKSRPDLVERNKIKGKRFWTNGVINKYVLPTETPPEGYWLGVTRKKTIDKKGIAFYTNGVINKMLLPNADIPIGFYKGFTKQRKK